MSKLHHENDIMFYFNGDLTPASEFYASPLFMLRSDRRAAITRRGRHSSVQAHPRFRGVSGRHEIVFSREQFLEMMAWEVRNFVEESAEEKREGILAVSQHWIVDARGASADIRMASPDYLEKLFDVFLWGEIIEELCKVFPLTGDIFIESIDTISIGESHVRLVGHAFKYDDRHAQSSEST
jgi:hypothetical protein